MDPKILPTGRGNPYARGAPAFVNTLREALAGNPYARGFPRGRPQSCRNLTGEFPLGRIEELFRELFWGVEIPERPGRCAGHRPGLRLRLPWVIVAGAADPESRGPGPSLTPTPGGRELGRPGSTPFTQGVIQGGSAQAASAGFSANIWPPVLWPRSGGKTLGPQALPPRQPVGNPLLQLLSGLGV
jgi:hypothetical protein